MDQLVEEDEVHYLNLECDFKYGTDGMNGNTQFKQLGAEATDSGCIQASHFVVLQVTTKVNGVRKLVYTNPLCNSSITCRPLRYWFTKETTGNTYNDFNCPPSTRGPAFLKDLEK